MEAFLRHLDNGGPAVGPVADADGGWFDPNFETDWPSSVGDPMPLGAGAAPPQQGRQPNFLQRLFGG